jgi:hypothetical protein
VHGFENIADAEEIATAIERLNSLAKPSFARCRLRGLRLVGKPPPHAAFDHAPVIATEMKASGLAKIRGVPEASVKRCGAH